MPTPQPLTLIVSDFTAGWREETERNPKNSALDRMLGRATLQVDHGAFEQRAFEPWQWRLLNTLGLDPSLPSHASAPLQWLAQTHQPASYCLHAEAVHFASGMDDLALRRLDASDSADVDTLLSSLSDLVGEAGFQLRCAAPGAWFLQSPKELQVSTCCPTAVAAVGMYDCMPEGAAARELQRLMTELQMRLHQHPVNHARASRGQVQINAVWFWGQGGLASTEGAQTLRPICSNDPYARGLSSHYSSSIAVLPDSAEESLPPNAIVLLPFPGLRALDQQWLAPLLDKIRSRAISRLELWLDDVHVVLDRAQLRRFWRHAKSLSEVSDRFTLTAKS
jgi:hypothetical protein